MKDNIMKIVTCALIILMSVSVASATDYYLATGGDNGEAGTSLETAWATPSYAVTQIYAGDTLWVVDGVYYDNASSEMYPANMGNETHWVRIKAYNGTPIWDGGGTYTLGLRIWHTTPYDPGYVEIDGIHIRKYGYDEIAIVNVRNIIVKNCIFANSSVALPTWTSLMDLGDGVRDVIIDNCSFIDAGDFGINAQGARYGTTTKIYNISITNCYFEDMSNHSAVQIADYASDVLIAGNTFVDCYDGAGTYFHETATNPNRQSNVTIKDNVFTDMEYETIVVFGTIDSVVMNNTINNSGNAAFTVGRYCNNVTVKDNTISGALRIHDDYTGEYANGLVIYENNIYSGIDRSNTYYMRAGGNLTIVNDVHQPSYQIEMFSNNTTGKTIIEYDDGKVFDYFIDTSTTYSLILPEWHPTKSNFTFSSGESVLFIIDIIPYNITLVPTNAYLKNVTVNKESNSTCDITNITINSSVVMNPTWLNTTMQNASNTYNISIDGTHDSQVVSDSSGVVHYQYTSSWSLHDFEIVWHSTEGNESVGITIPNEVYFYTFLIGGSVMNLAEIKASMDADGLDVWELCRWAGTGYSTTGDVNPCEGLTVYCNNTGEWTI